MVAFKTLWAIVTIDPQGQDRLAAIVNQQTGPLPQILVCADESEVPMMREVAVDIATKTRTPMRLVKFSTMESIEIITGEKLNS